jgi:ribonucleoside-diphosphate reductase alpha chain
MTLVDNSADVQTSVTQADYHSLNAMLNLYDADGKIQFDADREAAKQYHLQHVNPNTVFSHDLEEKLETLFEDGYYEKEIWDQYSDDFIKSLYKRVYAFKFRFPTFLGAYKFYGSYAMKTFDGKRYLERFEDRVAANALYLARGDEKLAENLVDEIVSGRYQPATPTFMNAGRKQRGEMVSCMLVRTEDNLESISRTVNAAMQLSKRGGGVAINITNIRESGAPIKQMQGQSSGVIPFAKVLDNAFVWINQLGQRQGAGAVYISAHHPDVMALLDSRRENADELVRIKSLSIGVVVPDITFELAKKGEPMYLFSPYDVERVYGKPFSDISITEKYREMVENPKISKTKIDARKFFQHLATLSAESGYPYIVFEDTVNKENAIDGRVSMSNLCTEILQVSTPSFYNGDLSYSEIGRDISCNLASLNIAAVMDGGDLEKTVDTGMRALTTVSDLSDISSVPSIEKGNRLSHAVGLGAMNLHGFLAREGIQYGSPEALDFVSTYFAAVNYYTLVSSNKIAAERGETFFEFEKSTYATGEYFDRYTTREWTPELPEVEDLFRRFGIRVPTIEDWEDLKAAVKADGLYHAYRQAIAPTGSISYINNSTASIHPITSLIEVRKEGKIGRAYYAAYGLTDENSSTYYDAYQLGPDALIDTYAAATPHIDQGASCTLFFDKDATDRDVFKAQQKAWKAGLKTLYYSRFQRDVIDGVEDPNICVSCAI